MWRVASVAAMAVLTLVGGLDTRLAGRGAGDPQTVPCSDPRFKKAELAAYKKLVKAQEEATRAHEDAITKEETRHKQKLAELDLDYQQALNKCGDAGCTTRATEEKDKWVNRELAYHDGVLNRAQDEEAKAKEQAKRKYDEAVESARQSYCGEEPSDAASAKQRAAERQRVQQAVTRVSTYEATIR
jgi:hypothetical protein